MATPEVDRRSPARRRRRTDRRGAADGTPDIPPDAIPAPVETHLSRSRRRPVAVGGIVENGLVRPLDTAVKLPEHSRVIIVAAEAI